MKHIGARIEDIENVKTNFIKLPEESLEVLKEKHGKTPSDYLIEYLQSSKLYEALFIKFTHYVHNTLPKKLKTNCLHCKGNSENDSDKKCTPYNMEANLNFFLASFEFVGTVNLNNHLINKPEDLKQLTLSFFECFLFSNGRVYFNIDKMTMHCLKTGFKTLSHIFENNENLQNLSNINNTLDKLNSEFLEFKMFNDEIPIHLEPQIDFFNNKLKTYKTRHFINQEIKKTIKNEHEAESIKSKKEKIEPKLKQYKFNELDKVKKINTENLLNQIFSNKLPYQIAYLDYLGFIDFVNKNYCKTQIDLQKILAKILETDNRTIRGHLNGLKNKKSKDRKRYTAYIHTNKVTQDYQLLK